MSLMVKLFLRSDTNDGCCELWLTRGDPDDKDHRLKIAVNSSSDAFFLEPRDCPALIDFLSAYGGERT